MKEKVWESERLDYYKMDDEDYTEVATMLQNELVMYAWEYTFTKQEVYGWIHRAIKRYARDGIGHFLAVDRDRNKVIGQIGLVKMSVNHESVIDLGYMLKAEEMKKGYAKEGGAAFLRYAFIKLQVDKVVSDIRPSNSTSIKTALSLRMKPVSSIIKNVNGKEMEHTIFEITKEMYFE